MKKILALLLCLSMVLSLVACQKAQSNTVPADGGTSAVASSVTVEEVVLQSGYSIDLDLMEVDFDSSAMLGCIKSVVASPLTAESYPALATALESYHAEKVAFYEGMRDEFGSEESDTSTEEGIFSTGYSVDAFDEVRRADDKVVSILTTTVTYTGGAHPNSSFWGASYDTQSGEAIELSDVCTDKEQLVQILEEQLTAEYPDTDFFGLSDALKSEAEEESLSFTVDAEGVTFFFSPYEIASYADGLLVTTVTFAEHSDILNGNYADAVQNYGATMYGSTGYRGVIDGRKVDINFWGENSDEELTDDCDFYSQLTVYMNGEYEQSQDLYFYGARGVLLHTAEGKLYLYVDFTTDNDWNFMRVYDLNGEKPVYVGELDNVGFSWEKLSEDDYARVLPVNAQCFELESRFDPLTTTSCVRYYHVGADGMPEANTTDYDLPSHFVLTAKADIAAHAIDTETNAVLEEITIPSGSKLTAYRTDATSYVEFSLEDGTYCRVDADLTGYPQTVNGVDADTLLDGILYAG